MNPVTRRTFVYSSCLAAAGAALGRSTLSAASASRVSGANDRINLVLVGCGGRGRFVARGLAERGATIVCLCDLREDRLDTAAQFLAPVQQLVPRREKHMQRVFEAKDLDAVIVATPDHWHGPATILACQAGKDVYVEKPHAHNIWESGQMVAAAKKYNRLVQVGTQNRSSPSALQARDYLQSGKLGKVHLVKVYNLKPGAPFRLGDPGQQPDLDWDAWLGRAPLRPFHQGILNSGWHHFWAYSGGDMADDGIHQLDISLMLMGDPGFPTSVRTIGGRYAHAGDDSEVPDVQIVNWDFGGKFVLTFEMTEYPKYMQKNQPTIHQNQPIPSWSMNATRVEVYGSELLLTLGRHGGGFVVQQTGGKLIEKVPSPRHPDADHYENFLACLRSRQKPNADISIAHTSNAVMHMGNIAHRVGNLALRYDAATGRFDLPAANALLKPEYRKGYEIPERV